MITALLVSVLVTGAYSLSPCLDGFFPTYHNDTCFKLVQSPLPWQSARQACQEFGDLNTTVDLVKFHSLDEDRQTRGRLPLVYSYWIGVNSIKEQNKYVWLDESNQTEYTRWIEGQPIHDSGLNCVISLDGWWSSLACNTPQAYVCGHTPRVTLEHHEIDHVFGEPVLSEDGLVYTQEVHTVPDSHACRGEWQPLGDVGCIKINAETKMTWSQARDMCGEDTADLLVVPSQSVHRLVKEALRPYNKQRFWIGLHSDEDHSLYWNDRVYKWMNDIDRRSTALGKFVAKATPEEGKSCTVALPWKESRWNFEACDELHYSVCMSELVINQLIPPPSRTIFLDGEVIEEAQLTTAKPSNTTDDNDETTTEAVTPMGSDSGIEFEEASALTTAKPSTNNNVTDAWGIIGSDDTGMGEGDDEGNDDDVPFLTTASPFVDMEMETTTEFPMNMFDDMEMDGEGGVVFDASLPLTTAEPEFSAGEEEEGQGEGESSEGDNNMASTVETPAVDETSNNNNNGTEVSGME